MAESRLLSAEYEGLVAKVGRIVAGVTGVTAEPQDDLSGLGVDSLQMLEILTALEDEFGIGMGENMIREFRNIDRIVRIIKDMVAAPAR